ncbi:hypothetical protein TorRG33x02_132660 [Trema orientale]|uniref:Uncharacterized protein n=1 Tax=Trema orientale TaxID=63057 RepID=A0A2P5EZA7_TREOI|nr:hypothetical protein TorRG33x02_132660 [Trema orientale]
MVDNGMPYFPFPNNPFKIVHKHNTNHKLPKTSKTPGLVVAVSWWLQPQQRHGQRYELDQQKGCDGHNNWGLVEGESACVHVILIST